MKIYSVAKVIIEVEVPEDNWEDIDFEKADKMALENLREICEINDSLPIIHFQKEEDAEDFVEW